MPYATQADLETRFGSKELAKLTDRTAGSVINAAVVDRALVDAAAEIDGYLAVRYQLPLASVPVALAQLACDIARYNLWGERATEAIKGRYDDAVRRLKAIAGGSFKLDAAAPLVEAAGSNEAVVSGPSRPRVFNGGRY